MKKSLTILVVGALVGTMLIGCGSGTEGNAPGNSPDGAVPTTKSGEAMNTPEANAPAMDANTPAVDANKPAMDANAPAVDANKPATP